MRETAFDSTRGSLLDRVIWRMRVSKVMTQLGGKVGTIVDLGCGREAPLLQALLSAGAAHRAFGVDLSPALTLQFPRLDLLRADLNGPLPLPEECADVVLSLAVFEHLTYPVIHLREIGRILKPHGRLLMTTPSPRGRPVLEFLVFRLGVIGRAEIGDHKAYFDGPGLATMLSEAGFAGDKVEIGTFQLGMNNIVAASR